MSRTDHDSFDAIIRAQGLRFRLSFVVRGALCQMLHSASWTSGWLSIGCLFGAPVGVIEHDRAVHQQSD